MDEGAVRVTVHRLRARYRALLRDEIAQTLDGPAQVAENCVRCKPRWRAGFFEPRMDTNAHE